MEFKSVNNQSVYQVNSVSGWRRLRLVLHYPRQGWISSTKYEILLENYEPSQPNLMVFSSRDSPVDINKYITYATCKTSYGRNSYSSKVLPDRINLVLCLPLENRTTIWTICSWHLHAKLSVPNKYSHVML